MRADLLILLAAFAAGTLLAELAGARNLGVALAFGQLAFGLALVLVLVRRPQTRPARAASRTSVPSTGPGGPAAPTRPAKPGGPAGDAPARPTRTKRTSPPPPPPKKRGSRRTGR